MFLDGPEAKARDAVHVLFAGEKVRSKDLVPAPDVEQAEVTAEFRLIALEPLVRMQLASFHREDRMHLRDFLDVGLIDATWLNLLPPPLAERLQQLLDHPE
jgi:hypothetical protein